MPEGLISQQTRKSIVVSRTLSGLFLVIGVLLAGGALLATGGVYFYHQLLNRQNDGLKTQVLTLENDIRANGTNQAILDLDAKLSSAKQLLSAHPISSNLFEFLEANTLPRIRFTTFALQSDSRQLNLAGEAATYGEVASQVRIFEAQPEIEYVDFGGLQIGNKGLLSFKMTLDFKPNMLLFKEN